MVIFVTCRYHFFSLGFVRDVLRRCPLNIYLKAEMERCLHSFTLHEYHSSGRHQIQSRLPYLPY